MCGIFGYVGSRSNGAEIVLSGLKKLEYRGYDSWGIAVKNQEKIIIKKEIGKIGKANVSGLPKSSIALGHTRWATHGGVTEANAHPHLDCNQRFAVVHNGIVENYQELKKTLKKRHKFISETDTEVMVHLIEEKALELGSFVESVRVSFCEAKGLNALIILDCWTNQIIVAKTGSPIVIAQDKDSCYLASDSASIIEFSKDLVFLEDNELAVLKNGSVELFSVNSGKKISLHKEHVNWNLEDSRIGKYDFFTLKEIEEQPKIVLNAINNYKKPIEDLLKIIGTKKINFTACGTAYFAGLEAVYYFLHNANVKSSARFASETLFLSQLSPKKDILFALSQSGETIDLIDVAKQVKNSKIKLLSAVNVLGSTLYRLSDEKVLLGAGPEIGVAATKSFMAKLCLMFMMSYAMLGKIDEAGEILADVAEGIENVLSHKISVKKLAELLSKHQHIFILGRDVLYPIALECALKIKEISYIHAEGIAGGELKHGTIALIENGTPCIVLAINDENYSSTISNAMELKARGGYIIGISPKKEKVFDVWLPVSDLGIATTMEEVVYAQLLGYYIALAKGLDPDKPRNLAKSVTVK